MRPLQRWRCTRLQCVDHRWPTGPRLRIRAGARCQASLRRRDRQSNCVGVTALTQQLISVAQECAQLCLSQSILPVWCSVAGHLASRYDARAAPRRQRSPACSYPLPPCEALSHHLRPNGRGCCFCQCPALLRIKRHRAGAICLIGHCKHCCAQLRWRGPSRHRRSRYFICAMTKLAHAPAGFCGPYRLRWREAGVVAGQPRQWLQYRRASMRWSLLSHHTPRAAHDCQPTQSPLVHLRIFNRRLRLSIQGNRTAVERQAGAVLPGID